jgi:hypothetical protein
MAKKKRPRGKKNHQRDAEHFFDHEEEESSGKGVEFIDEVLSELSVGAE